MAAVKKFQGKACISSADFIEIFKKYDKDGNGLIEAGELDSFLNDLAKEYPSQDTDVDSLKELVLEKYDKNCDRKFNMEELNELLPTEQNFLASIRNDCQESTMSRENFLEIWNHYDSDKNGYLESSELDGFLRDFLTMNSQFSSSNLTPATLADYKSTILFLYDTNNDGKLDLSELAKLLPVKENFMQFRCRESLTREDFDKIFNAYDQDGSGKIEEKELRLFLKDLNEKAGEKSTSEEIEKHMKTVLELFDTDKDGKLSKDELRMVLSKM